MTNLLNTPAWWEYNERTGKRLSFAEYQRLTPAQMAEGGEWQPFQTRSGKRAWRNTSTGERRYQNNKPGSLQEKKDFVKQVQERQAPTTRAPEGTPIPGMEGPYRFRSGREAYYDPKEGKYYDRKEDRYLEQNEVEVMHGMREPKPAESQPQSAGGGEGGEAGESLKGLTDRLTAFAAESGMSLKEFAKHQGFPTERALVDGAMLLKQEGFKSFAQAQKALAVDNPLDAVEKIRRQVKEMTAEESQPEPAGGGEGGFDLENITREEFDDNRAKIYRQLAVAARDKIKARGEAARGNIGPAARAQATKQFAALERKLYGMA